MTSRPRFHLAFPIRALAPTRRFYTDVLGCREGRSAERWVDFDFFGHQISAHVVERSWPSEGEEVATNPVDGDDVPARHFGAIVEWADFDVLVARLKGHAVTFLIEPRVRFVGEVGEQATMFILDPSGNALEFKAFRNPDQVFAR
jgi:uncharacterized protein